MRQDGTARVAVFTLDGWDQRSPVVRQVAPWERAGAQVLRGTLWDRVFSGVIDEADLVILHRDFPRLATAYQQVIQQARSLGIPVFFDLDDLLFDLPEEHPDRQYHYLSDALFPILQAVLEADAVTVSTPALQEAIQPLNPNTLLLPTCLDDSLWTIAGVQSKLEHSPLIIGWINDQLDSSAVENCTVALAQFLHQQKEDILLRVWGRRPPDSLLALPNVDWLVDLPTGYARFAAQFTEEHIDLALVPHGDEPFDRCQSPLRFFEHSACGTAGIYSRVRPYRDVISQNENGWLVSTAEEWMQALEALSGSAEMRDRIAASAQNSVREHQMLSQNAYRWKDALDRSTGLAEQHKQFQTVASQATHLSEQVRAWQRDLERRLYDREWELRATHLMMVRKDRQASEYIQQLGSQLEKIWGDPAWRMLNKAKQLVKRAAAPSAAETPSENASSPESERISSNEGPVFGDLPQAIAPALTFDLLWFADCRWAELAEVKRSRALEFAGDGIRVVLVSSSNQPDDPLTIRQATGGIYELALPRRELIQDSDSTQAAATTDPDLNIFAGLRQELGIHAAICWIDDPLWANTGYLLRNLYGWKMAAQARRSEDTKDPHNLILRSDLISHNPVEEMPYTAMRQELLDLFPLVSIVILTYNNLGYTKQCLDSILDRTAYPNYEIIIVDNASTDGSVDYLNDFAASHQNVNLVINKENRGFSAGNNQGLASSEGEYIVFLNNDTIVTRGWLSGLIAHLRDPATGAVGPVTNSSGNESKIAVDYSDLSGLEDFAKRNRQAHSGQSFDIRMLALYCMLVRRSVIDEVGPLDERFGVGMYEDDDFSLRIRQKGYRILCAEDVYIHHWGSASFSRLAEEHYQRLYLENRRVFEEKWGTEWQPHRWRMDEA